jgi:hypothetical protein
MFPMKMPIAAMLSLCAALSAPVWGPPLELHASKAPREHTEARSPEAPSGESRTSTGEPQPSPGETPQPDGDAPQPPGPDAEEAGRQGVKLDSIGEEYLAESERFLDGGDVAGALAALLRARARSPRNRKLERELREITGAMRSEAYYTPEPLQIGKGIPSPLQLLLTYESGGGAVPVAGMPVAFDFLKGNGVLTDEAITNDLGIAKCYVESITDAAEGVLIRGRVTLKVDDLEVELDRLTQTYEFTSFSIFDAPHSLLASGGETQPLSDDLRRAVCAELEALFTARGFTRFTCGSVTHPSLFRRAMDLELPAVRLLGDEQGAKVLLLVDIRTAFLSQPSPDFHFFRASLAAKMIDAQSFHLYFESAKEERGAGPTPYLAERQAVRNALARLSAELESYLGTLR